jgi:hypothetical protein
MIRKSINNNFEECEVCGEMTYEYRGPQYSQEHTRPDGSSYLAVTEVYECLNPECDHHDYYMVSYDLD